jgi:hypothetical protein
MTDTAQLANAFAFFDAEVQGCGDDGGSGVTRSLPAIR